MDPLQLKTEGDRFVVVTRRFNATPERVYQAHVDPKIVQQWMLGPDGWTMPICEMEQRPGGKIHYRWEKDGEGFDLTGEVVELDPPHRIVHIERMHLPDPTPDNHVVTTFEPCDGGTLMTMRMTLPDQVTREMMLSTGMEHGMEMSYTRLEREVLAQAVN